MSEIVIHTNECDIDSNGDLLTTLNIRIVQEKEPPKGEIVFWADFSDVPKGPATADRIADIFNTRQVRIADGAQFTDDPANSGRGNVLALYHPEGTMGRDGGGQWVTRIPPADEYWLYQDVYVEEGYVWPLSCKLPGLFGGDLGKVSGGKTPDGITGFALRQGITSEGDGGYSGIGYGQLAVNRYVFQVRPGKRTIYQGARLIPGQWCTIVQHIRLNDPDVANGLYEAFVDGELVLRREEEVYRITEDLQIDGVSWVWYYGGAGDRFNARENQFIYSSNLIISTEELPGVSGTRGSYE